MVSFPNQIESADVSIKINAHTGPVQARCDLFNVGGFAGAVKPLQSDASIVRKTRENAQRHLRVKPVRRVNFRDMIIALLERGHCEVRVNAKGFSNTHEAAW
jgi:hypothetical protein